jgi:transcriptional regulator with XRE-family HTH domain
MNGISQRVAGLVGEAPIAEAAEALGIDRVSLWRICTGKLAKSPSADTLVKIATHYGVSIDWLVNGEEAGG